MDRLVVFAKAPQSGRVKTRLAPLLGDDGAARVYECFVRDVVERVTKAAPGNTVLYHDPVLPGSLLSGLGVELRPQQGADLGARLQHAFAEQRRAGASRVVVIGCDSPDLPGERYAQAFTALEEADLVIGPAVDGGYYLIGARGKPEATLEAIPWGTSAVLEATLAAARVNRIRTALLDVWYDIDRPDDLAFLRTHLEFLVTSRDEDRCPHTRAFLRRRAETA